MINFSLDLIAASNSHFVVQYFHILKMARSCFKLAYQDLVSRFPSIRQVLTGLRLTTLVLRHSKRRNDYCLEPTLTAIHTGLIVLYYSYRTDG